MSKQCHATNQKHKCPKIQGPDFFFYIPLVNSQFRNSIHICQWHKHTQEQKKSMYHGIFEHA